MAKRVTSIGGQALLEGILMVGPKKNVAAFCDEAGKYYNGGGFHAVAGAKNTPF